MNFSHKCLDIETLVNLVSNVEMNSQEFLKMVLNTIDSVEAVVCAKDISGRHYLVNRYYEKAVGIAPHEVLGKTDEEIFSFAPEVAKSIREQDQKVATNRQTVFFEEYVPDIHGVYRWYYTNKAPIFDDQGNVVAIMCLAVDITKKKEAEDKLYAATRAKNTFLAKMSHEIRTPISAIAGYLDLAKNSDETTSKAYLDKMSNSVDHLLNLVDDILDLSSIEANKLKLSPGNFVFSDLLDSVVANLSHKAEENKIRMVKQYKPNRYNCLFGDETRIKQIIFNLVSNAIKFSWNSSVTIRAHIKAGKGGKLKLTVLVRDEGIGMEPGQKNNIFRAFEQLNSSSHYFKGSGLGLSIVKELTEIMGGKVKIFTRSGAGTLVAVSMILDRCVGQCSMKTEEESKPNKLNLAGRKVVVVEDQPFNREILETMLRSEGAETCSFEDGADLVQMVEEGNFDFKPDCFLLDVHMPVLSGPETLVKLRQHKAYSQTPAFIVTADAIKSNLETYLSGSYNLTGIFVKPLKRDDLVRALSCLPEKSKQSLVPD